MRKKRKTYTITLTLAAVFDEAAERAFVLRGFSLISLHMIYQIMYRGLMNNKSNCSVAQAEKQQSLICLRGDEVHFAIVRREQWVTLDALCCRWTGHRMGSALVCTECAEVVVERKRNSLSF